jgi:hypothetical protein
MGGDASRRFSAFYGGGMGHRLDVDLVGLRRDRVVGRETYFRFYSIPL